MIQVEKIQSHRFINKAALRKQGWKWFMAVIGLQLLFILSMSYWQYA